MDLRRRKAASAPEPRTDYGTGVVLDPVALGGPLPEGTDYSYNWVNLDYGEGVIPMAWSYVHQAGDTGGYYDPGRVPVPPPAVGAAVVVVLPDGRSISIPAGMSGR